MQDFPLTIAAILRYAVSVHGDRTVTTATGADGYRHATYAEVGGQAARLANALRRLGITGDERVATFMWNTQEHLEAYVAVPSMGAVLHTLNIRLFPEQIEFVANEAEDRVVIADLSLAPLLAPVCRAMETVHTVIAVGEGDRVRVGGVPGKPVLRYHEITAAESAEFDWPDVDENSAAAMCYTSGTTGQPEGRGVQPPVELPALGMAVCSGNGMGLSFSDKALPIVPMFHANAWGLPYAALMAGADLVMPDRFMDAASMVNLIETQRPTVAGAVPTIWNDVMNYLDCNRGHDISSLRLVACGGSAVPVSLMKTFEERARRADPPAVGDDRDLADGDAGLAAAGRPRGPALGAARNPGPAGVRGGGAHRRRRGRGDAQRRRVGRRARGARSVDHRRRTTATPTSRSSSPAGCAPATSAASTPRAT